eukprot:gene19436-25316_t
MPMETESNHHNGINYDNSNEMEVEFEPSNGSHQYDDPSDDKEDVSVKEEIPTIAIPKPSLRGKFTTNSNIHICSGVWAMSDEGHTHPDQTSPFEFKLFKPFDGQTLFPISGKYQGWFYLKQLPPNKGLKIDEKDMTLKFTRSEDKNNTYTIEGFGSNRFGSFTLYGILTDYDIQLYREYTPKSVNGIKSKPVSTNKHKNGISNKPLTIDIPTVNAVADPVIAPTPTSIASTPRESSGRVRKVSNVMKEYEDAIHVPKAKPFVKNSHNQTNTAVVYTPNNISNSTVTSGRSHRLPLYITKCMDLLKEMQKHPQGVYFLEPVDDIKLGIPDYKLIIQKPIDFSTINQKLQSNQYENSEQFAFDMRLVFRNAITYNQLRDHPVHIAARELSVKFEERYRVILNQLNISNAIKYSSLNDIIPAQSNKTKKSNKSLKINTSSKYTSNSSKQLSSTKSLNQMPKSYDAFFPPVMDQSSTQLLEMQRRMIEMQEELKVLHTMVRQSEVKTSLEVQREAAHNPLTLEEKRILISKIQQLPPDKMEYVIEIIQAAIPHDQNGSEDMEVPLDALDTLTLRKLQQYVEKNLNKKAPLIARSQSFETHVTKKPRTSKHKSVGYNEPSDDPTNNDLSSDLADTSTTHRNHDMLSMEEDELLFDPDSFEEDHNINEISSSQVVDNNITDSIITDGLIPSPVEPMVNISVKDTNAWFTVTDFDSNSNEATIKVDSHTDDKVENEADWLLAAKEFQEKQKREQQRKDEEERIRVANRTNLLVNSSNSNSTLVINNVDLIQQQREDEKLYLMKLRKDEENQRKLLEQQAANEEDDELNEFIF